MLWSGVRALGLRVKGIPRNIFIGVIGDEYSRLKELRAKICHETRRASLNRIHPERAPVVCSFRNRCVDLELERRPMCSGIHAEKAVLQNRLVLQTGWQGGAQVESSGEQHSKPARQTESLLRPHCLRFFACFCYII